MRAFAADSDATANTLQPPTCPPVTSARTSGGGVKRGRQNGVIGYKMPFLSSATLIEVYSYKLANERLRLSITTLLHWSRFGHLVAMAVACLPTSIPPTLPYIARFDFFARRTRSDAAELLELAHKGVHVLDL